jgi:hypothetical protein
VLGHAAIGLGTNRFHGETGLSRVWGNKVKKPASSKTGKHEKPGVEHRSDTKNGEA